MASPFTVLTSGEFVAGQALIPDRQIQFSPEHCLPLGGQVPLIGD